MEQYLEQLDYIAIGIYILLMAVIGLSLGRFVKDISSYFKGSGTIPWVMAGITGFFSLFSTFVFIAYAGIAYKDGLIAVIVFWATVPACVIGGCVLAKRWRRTGYLTPMQYVEVRYGLPVQQAITWISLILRFLDNMIRMYAIGIFIMVVTPISLEWAIIISGIIYTTFNLAGGLWSIVVMSIVQFIILAFIILILLSLSLMEVGGMSGLYEKIPEHMIFFKGEKSRLFWLVVFYIMTLFNYNQKWTFIQKFYCVKDEKSAIKVGILAGILFLVFIPIFLLPAVASNIILPDVSDPEMSYVLLSKLLLPPGLMGILFASMFASTMSTLNGEFNVMAGVLTNDVYKKLINPESTEKRLLAVARVCVVLIGSLVTLGGIYMKNLGGAFEANKLFAGIFAIPIGFPFLLGLLFKRPGSVTAVATILVGVMTGIVLNAMPEMSWEWATCIEIIVCSVIYFVPEYVIRRQVRKKKAVENLFGVLNTPIKNADKPLVDRKYVQAVTNLFILSLLITGILFISMSLFSSQSAGGKLGLAAGSICLIGALCWWICHRIHSRKIS